MVLGTLLEYIARYEDTPSSIRRFLDQNPVAST
uniref:Uncharacterized protein n=1 Tax=Anguilla anguilla TaxID=7936 RepID=A0A0E9TUQ7_ANGAN